jgi:ribosomal protein L7/L12
MSVYQGTQPKEKVPVKILNTIKSVTMQRWPIVNDEEEGRLILRADTEDGGNMSLSFSENWDAEDVADIAGALLDGGTVEWDMPELKLSEAELTWMEVWDSLPEKKIHAIKAMRRMTGASLKIAKAAIDAIREARMDGIMLGKDGVGLTAGESLQNLIDDQIKKADTIDMSAGMATHCGDGGCVQCNDRYGQLSEVSG